MNDLNYPLFIWIIAGAIIFVVILNVFRQQLQYGNFSATILSICVTGLCLIGMAHTFPGMTISRVDSSPPNQEKWLIDIVLLPYTVLGILILLMFILVFLFGKSSRRSTEKPRKRRSEDWRHEHS